MNNISSEEIKKIVRDIVAELGLGASERAASGSASRSKEGPTALIVFHAGIRKLDEAMRQVRLIEQAAGKSGVFTGESARPFLCRDDVREKSGVRCLLDTVKPEGLEKVLSLADVLVLPTFCIRAAAKVAHFLEDSLETNIVLSALFQGKKVLASKDSFLVCDLLTNAKLREEINRILEKLESFGMVFQPTEKLFEGFKEITGPGQAPEIRVSREVPEKASESAFKLITAKHIHAAVNDKRDSIELAVGGKVTPLARDLAKEYSVKIVEALG